MFKIDSRDLQELHNNLKIISEKKAAFAMSGSLNASTFDAQKKVKKRTREAFDLKTNWLLKGIRVKKARTGQIESAVYSKDAYLKNQEFGGIKYSKDGSNLSIPFETPNNRRTASGKIRRADWASNLLKDRPGATMRGANKAAGKKGGRGNRGTGRPKAFVIVKGGKKYIVRSKRRRTKRTKAPGAKENIMFHNITLRARIKPKWRFRDTARKEFSNTIYKHFENNLDKLVLELGGRV